MEEKCGVFWMGFNALDIEKTGFVAKSMLKAYTGNIGIAIGLNKTEEGIDELLPEYDTLNFTDFHSILDENIISSILIQEAGNDKLHYLSEKIDYICFHTYRNRLFQDVIDLATNNVSRRKRTSNVFDELDCYKLFRIFGQFCEENPNFEEAGRSHSSNVSAARYILNVEEVEYISKLFNELQGNTLDELEDKKLNYSFPEFVFLIESEFTSGISKDGLKEALADLYNNIMEGVLKKGLLCKQGHALSTWKERWFVLKPGLLTWYQDQQLRGKKGSTILNSICRVQHLPGEGKDRIRHYSNLFQLVTPKKTYVLSATESKIKQQWIRALEQGIQLQSEGCANLQRLKFKERRYKRRDSDRLQELEQLQQVQLGRGRMSVDSLMLKSPHSSNVGERRSTLSSAGGDSFHTTFEGDSSGRLSGRSSTSSSSNDTSVTNTAPPVPAPPPGNPDIQHYIDQMQQDRKDKEYLESQLAEAAQSRILLEEVDKRCELERLQEEQESAREQAEGQREALLARCGELEGALDKLQRDREHSGVQVKEVSARVLALETLNATLRVSAAEKRLQYMEFTESNQLSLAVPCGSHRGPGFFCEGDFMKREKND